MLELNGQRLSLAEISAVAHGEDHVTLSNDARTRVEKSRRVVEKIVAEGRTVYGVNTGFGRLSDVHIPAAELRELTESRPQYCVRSRFTAFRTRDASDAAAARECLVTGPEWRASGRG